MSAAEDVPGQSRGRAGIGGVAVVAGAAVIIALSFVMARLTYDAGSNPLTVIALRYPVVALIVGALVGLRGGSLALARRDLPAGYGVGLVYFVGTGCYLASILYLPVSLAVLVFYTYPLMTVVFESALGRRLPRLLDVVAFLVAFGGLALALQVSFAGLDPRGIAFALVGAVGASAAFVWTGRALPHVNTLVLSFHMSVCGTLVAALAVLASGALALPATGAAGWGALAATIICFAVAFIGMFTGVRMIGAVRTSMVMNLEPIATIGLAVLLLGESLTLQQLVGAALVLGAVALAQRPAAAR